MILLSEFALGVLDQIRLRHLMAGKVNPAIAANLVGLGYIQPVEGLGNDVASSVAMRTGHHRWRITDAGLIRLGKERVW